MHQCPHDQLVAFIITFLKNTKYVKNPYLKAKLVEVNNIYKDVPHFKHALL